MKINACIDTEWGYRVGKRIGQVGPERHTVLPLPRGTEQGADTQRENLGAKIDFKK